MMRKVIRAVQVPWIDAVRQSTPFTVLDGAQVVGAKFESGRGFVLVLVVEDVEE